MSFATAFVDTLWTWCWNHDRILESKDKDGRPYHTRVRIIPDRDDPNKDYLIRCYPLFRRHSWFQLFNVTLHKILASDPADLHDHPWPYITIILTGGYWEHTTKGRFWRKPGSILFRRAKSLHRLETDPAAGPVHTLFFMGPRIRAWGFKAAAGWMDWKTYHNKRKQS